jgi:UDPglucose 6-dehydrogenase
MREAPALTLIEGLLARGARVHAYDPQAAPVARRLFGERIGIAGDPLDALAGADALVLATEWSEFRQADPGRMRALMRQPVVFDGRNLFDPALMARDGFVYFSVGRGVRSTPAERIERFAAASYGLDS